MSATETGRIGRPKIAVYGIARDEAHHVARWAESARDADLILLADTGSTDGTVAAARTAGVRVEEVRVEPWRYDAARNRALDLLPEDIDLCVSLDIDEVLVEGWREALEDTWRQGATRVRCHYEWPWSAWYPSLRFTLNERIHARQGYRWRYPVHEEIVATEPAAELEVMAAIEIRHLRDSVGSRPHYLPLLRIRAEEHPDDGRTAHLLASEARMSGNDAEAIAHERRALALPLTPNERLHALLSMAVLEPVAREAWLLAACAGFPGRREPWCDLAQLLLDRGDWRASRQAAHNALRITVPPDDYLTNVFAWGAWPEQIAAGASIGLGERDWALHHARRALDAAPWDESLRELLAQTAAAVIPVMPTRWPNRTVRRRSLPGIVSASPGSRPRRSPRSESTPAQRRSPDWSGATPRRASRPQRGRRTPGAA